MHITNSVAQGQNQTLFGELTIKDITREIKFDVNINPSKNTLTIVSGLSIDRVQYGIEFKSKTIEAGLDNFIYDNFDLKTQFVAVR